MKQNQLVEIINDHACRKGEKTAFIELMDDKEIARISFKDFYSRVVNLEKYFCEQRLTGKLFVLLFPAGIEAVVTLMACFYAGVIPIQKTFAPNITSEKQVFQLCYLLKNINQIFGIISTSKILEKIEHNSSLRNLENIAINNLPKSRKKKTFNKTENHNLSDTDFVQLTSGSTTSIKGAKISIGNLLSNAAYCQKMWEVSSDSIIINWTPHSHVLGLVTGLLLPLYSGSTSVIMSPSDFSRDPLLWIKNISKYMVTHSAAPNFAYNLCAAIYSADRMNGCDLSRWVAAVSGGESIKFSTMKHFYNNFSKHGFNYNSFCPSYGMSENSGLIVSLAKSAPVERCLLNQNEFEKNKNRINQATDRFNTHDASIFVSLGKPDCGTDILIVEPYTLNRLPENNIGEILVSSSSLFSGYINIPNDNLFYTLPNNNGEMKRFFRTGDIGFIKSETLYIVGRLKEIIIIKGKNYSPVDIEYCAKQIKFANMLGKNAAFSLEINNQEVIILFQEINPKLNVKQKDELTYQIQEKINCCLNLSLHEIVLLESNCIPTTDSGKIKRLECKQLYLDKYSPCITDS